MLTEAWNGRGRDADVPAARSSGGSLAAFRRGCCRGSPASGSRDSSRGVPAEVLRGSGRAKGHRRREIEAAQRLTGGDARARFRRCRGLGPELWALEAF